MNLNGEGMKENGAVYLNQQMRNYRKEYIMLKYRVIFEVFMKNTHSCLMELHVRKDLSYEQIDDHVTKIIQDTYDKPDAVHRFSHSHGTYVLLGKNVSHFHYEIKKEE